MMGPSADASCSRESLSTSQTGTLKHALPLFSCWIQNTLDPLGMDQIWGVCFAPVHWLRPFLWPITEQRSTLVVDKFPRSRYMPLSAVWFRIALIRLRYIVIPFLLSTSPGMYEAMNNNLIGQCRWLQAGWMIRCFCVVLRWKTTRGLRRFLIITITEPLPPEGGEYLPRSLYHRGTIHMQERYHVCSITCLHIIRRYKISEQLSDAIAVWIGATAATATASW